MPSLDKPKNLKLQMMPGPRNKGSPIREERFKLTKKRDPLTVGNMLVLALGTAISQLKTTTGCIVWSLQEVEVRTVETGRDLKMTPEIIDLYEFCDKTLKENVLSLTERLSSVCLERARLRADIDEMTVMVQQMKEGFGKFLPAVSMEVQKIYDDMAKSVEGKIQEDLVDGWKTMETLSLRLRLPV